MDVLHYNEKIERALLNRIDRERRNLSSAAGKMEALNPLSVISRGYAMVNDESQNSIASVMNVHEGKRVIVRLRDGAFTATVDKIVID
jgi:exodeoxyribonuclease VII large subunit